MAETITLPRSGVVLKFGRFGIASADILNGHVHLVLDRAGTPNECGDGIGRFRGTTDTCIAWLDERVLALRAALLPADALARALWATVLRDRYGESDSWDELPTCKKDAAIAVAHSVLAALGGKP